MRTIKRLATYCDEIKFQTYMCVSCALANFAVGVAATFGADVTAFRPYRSSVRR